MIILHNIYDKDSRNYVASNSEGNEVINWFENQDIADEYILEGNPPPTRFPAVLDDSGKWKVVVNAAHEEVDLDQAIEDAKWVQIRYIRDTELCRTDYTQVSDYDYGLTEEQKSEFATYRQTLRDIPQDYTNAEDVVFPDLPSLISSSSSSSSTSS